MKTGQVTMLCFAVERAMLTVKSAGPGLRGICQLHRHAASDAPWQIGSIRHLFGGSQRLVSPDRRRHLPSAGRAGSPISVQSGVTPPSFSRRRPRRHASHPSAGFLDKRRRWRHSPNEVIVGSPRLVEQPPRRWRSARRSPRGFGLRRFRIQVGEGEPRPK